MSVFKLCDPDCVLIHIPKTAGTSIRKGCWESRYEGPVFGHVPPEWQNLFSFAFVRHPFDRLISAWKMFSTGIGGPTARKAPPTSQYMSLEAFCDIVTDQSIIYDERRKTVPEQIRHHTIPQTHPFNCLEDAQFIGRFEKLDEDFQKIANLLGKSMILPKFHFTEHSHWETYMSKELIIKMASFYERDFSSLNYSQK